MPKFRDCGNCVSAFCAVMKECVNRPAKHAQAESMATYRHVKRGTTYQVVGTAELQAAACNVHEGDKLTIYRGEDGKLWARHEDEFHDGRFEQVEDTLPPAQDVAAPVEALERLETTMDSHSRIGLPEYLRKLHAGYWRDEVARIRTALAKFGDKP